MKKKIVHLLMIEDSFGDARLIYEMLRDSSTIDFKIEQAFRLSTGLELLKSKDFDIVLLDLALPDSFGLDTLKSVIPEAKGIPIVVMTANDDEALGIKAVQLGAQDYIMKLQYDSYTFVKALCFAIERKKNEEILAYQTKLLDNVNDAIIVLDKDFKITSWNKAAEKIYGWKENEAVGRKICDLITSGFCKQKRQESLIFLSEGQINLNETVHLSRTGKKLYIEERTIAMFSSDGILTGYICLNRDITDSKILQEKLKSTNSLIQVIFDHTNIMLALLDNNFNFIKVNQAFAKADMHEPEFYIGKNHFDLFPDLENESIFKNVITTGQAYTVSAKSFENKSTIDRSGTYWNLDLIPVKDQQGEITGLILSILDATNRFREQALTVD